MSRDDRRKRRCARKRSLAEADAAYGIGLVWFIESEYFLDVVQELVKDHDEVARHAACHAANSISRAWQCFADFGLKLGLSEDQVETAWQYGINLVYHNDGKNLVEFLKMKNIPDRLRDAMKRARDAWWEKRSKNAEDGDVSDDSDLEDEGTADDDTGEVKP